LEHKSKQKNGTWARAYCCTLEKQECEYIEAEKIVLREKKTMTWKKKRE
jgi:hypothetical protein